MSISEIFIRRPVATTLLAAALAIAGIIGFKLLPISPLPPVEFPTIAVFANLPGGDPETMATSVAAPLERQFGQIAGINEMTSTSYRGSTTIALQFDLNRDINGAARDVQAAINAARAYLPATLRSNPIYRKLNPADAPVLILALSSDVATPPQIFDAASSIIQQRLSQVPGVGQVVVGGSSLPAVRVELNPGALNRSGISLEQVRGILSSTSVNRPKGQIWNQERSWEISTNDQLFKAAEYEPVILSYRSGAALRLFDAARVTDSVEDVRTLGLVDGKPAVMVIIFRQPGANIIETVDHVLAVMPGLAASMPGSIRSTVVLDRTPPIRGSLRDVGISLVISAILVIFVVFLFLRNIRATIIPGIAIVLSLVGTFAVMYLLNFNMDNLSLMALTIATGFVVDDAIVVLENSMRHLEAGMHPMEASLRGSAEITFTVLSMSISLVAVFIPLLFMGDIPGRLLREFAVTLSVAVAVSMVVSLTVTPMMCSILLKKYGKGKRHRLYEMSENGFRFLYGRYETSLRWGLSHPVIMLLSVIACIFGSMALFLIIPKGFFPEQDTGRIIGTIMAEQDVSFQTMETKLRQVVDIVMADNDIEHVAAFTGGGGGSTTNTARMFIALKPPGIRKSTAQQVIGRLRGRLGHIPGTPTFLQVMQELRVGGRLSGGMYQYTLTGEDLRLIETWSPQLLSQMRQLRSIVDVNNDQQNKGLEVRLDINRTTASRLGITPQMIDDILYDAFGQRQASISYTSLNQYRTIMEFEPSFWQRPESLDQVYVRSGTGSIVPLSAFSKFSRNWTSLAVNHQGQFPAVTFSFNLPQGVSLGQAVRDVEDAARAIRIPHGLRGNFQGTAQVFQSARANMPWLILAALIAVYIVLGILYESYVHPLTILSTLPSAGVGALLALLVFRFDFSIIALIGIILLIGLVKKNGIMMVDFALEAERKDLKEPEEAIYQASLLRFRPIMMTTMAALFGALPLALGTGMGSEFRQPLGIAIVGGLIFSQLLTLYTTPVMYLYLDRFRLKARHLWKQHFPWASRD